MKDQPANLPKKTSSERLREASQQRRQQEKADVRQAILHTSSALFLEKGYENFSLRQVAERIGYSPGTIYLYFQNKDEILFTIMVEGVARFTEVFKTAAATPDPRERLENIGQAYLTFGLEYPAHYQLMFMQRPDFFLRGENNNADAQPLVEIFELWRTAIEDAMKTGVLRMGDPVSTGDALWAMLHGVLAIAILMPQFDEKRTREMTTTALEMLKNGLHKP